MLQSALDAYRVQARTAALGVAAARRVRTDPRRLVQVVSAFQFAAAQVGAESVGLMLAEQGIVADPVAAPLPRSVSGVASDGRPLGGLLSLADSWGSLDRMVATQIQDAGRAGASLAAVVRPAVTRYVRMVNLPACSRCILLAGRSYRMETAFNRHPKCDCRHIPTVENLAGDVTTDPTAAFRTLTTEQQDRIFTKAGAQALRDGADMSRVVNARSGMSSAQVGGRRLRTTTAGPRRRGMVRLMPESIYDLAGGDRKEALRLLQVHGYITRAI